MFTKPEPSHGKPHGKTVRRTVGGKGIGREMARLFGSLFASAPRGTEFLMFRFAARWAIYGEKT